MKRSFLSLRDAPNGVSCCPLAADAEFSTGGVCVHISVQPGIQPSHSLETGVSLSSFSLIFSQIGKRNFKLQCRKFSSYVGHKKNAVQCTEMVSWPWNHQKYSTWLCVYFWARISHSFILSYSQRIDA